MRKIPIRWFSTKAHTAWCFSEECFGNLGDRRAVLANDLTKKFERIVRGKLSEIIPIIENSPIKGEFVICIAGFEDLKAKNQSD